MIKTQRWNETSIPWSQYLPNSSSQRRIHHHFIWVLILISHWVYIMKFHWLQWCYSWFIPKPNKTLTVIYKPALYTFYFPLHALWTEFVTHACSCSVMRKTSQQLSGGLVFSWCFSAIAPHPKSFKFIIAPQQEEGVYMLLRAPHHPP